MLQHLVEHGHRLWGRRGLGDLRGWMRPPSFLRDMVRVDDSSDILSHNTRHHGSGFGFGRGASRRESSCPSCIRNIRHVQFGRRLRLRRLSAAAIALSRGHVRMAGELLHDREVGAQVEEIDYDVSARPRALS